MVSVDRTLARKDLLLSKKAVYASPFDLKYYSDMKTVGFNVNLYFSIK